MPNAPRLPEPVLHVRPRFAEWLLPLLLVAVGALLLIFGSSWSRVVTIQCHPAGSSWGRCHVLEETLFRREERFVEVPWPFEATVAGEVDRDRGDTWIAVSARELAAGQPAPAIRITRPYAGDHAGQIAAAAALSQPTPLVDTGIRVTMGGGTQTLRAQGPTAKVSFGQRWRMIGVAVAAALVGLVAAATVARKVTRRLGRRADRGARGDGPASAG